MAIETINPADNKLVKTFEKMSDTKVSEIISSSEKAFQTWRLTLFEQRAELLIKTANVLRNSKLKYAEIMTLEMGKPITQAISEVEKCAWVCEYYAQNAETILQKEIIETDASESFVQFDPIGIVLAVMPWNYPFWQVFRFAAPALMAGNVCLLKHASNVPMSALAIEEIFTEAGLPEGTFKTLLIESSQVNNVIQNPLIKATTLTGSEPAGMAVASASGKALKKSVMELGGSDPFIVLSDANIDEAVKVGVLARILNNGQSCIAAKRFILLEDIADEFESKFVDKMNSLIVGNPMEKETELGPIAREDLLLELDYQVKETEKQGAKVLCGGNRLNREGAFYPPTVLSNVKKGMLAYTEELFGPVAIIIRAINEGEAIDIANDTPFGLGASLWTNNMENAKILAAKIESGSVFINGLVKSDPRLPFGGIKTSGYGRELSHYGIKEFVNIKTVWIK
ncbi:MAG: NAD-dependent succinate-semialdehyde dehydrogenase [Bacteroidetes bacterium]|nr:NAD-dependent succinate-semialdehyde dehydrogenase [Bacteroidota bacterium]MBU1116667.1 NAD-dependent succinate-semialdehyde dehydrogenase [Bacteroidota bacterium]MBU1798751.1 NAD-dependent succinate-semialdehyde dehydrogenase [Bacteroidota bacterium]